jgi:flagellin-specific chaperone FliS
MDLAHCSKEPFTQDKIQNANKRKIIVVLYQGKNAFKIRLANIIELEKFRTQPQKMISLY